VNIRLVGYMNRNKNKKPTINDLYQSIMNKKKSETNIISLIDKGVPVEFTESSENEIQQQPLHLAAFKGYGHVVQKLVDAGANPNAKSSMGLPPITEAFAQGHLDTAKILVANGANIKGIRIDSYDFHKNIPFLAELLLSSRKYFLTTIRYYSDLIPIDEILETKKLFEELYAKEQTNSNQDLIHAIESIYKRRTVKNTKNNTMKQLRNVYYNAPPMPGMSTGGPGFQEAKEAWEINTKPHSGGKKRVYRTRTRRLYN